MHLQVQLLDEVKDVPHVIQLAASGRCMYLDNEWNVAVIKPYVRLLTPSDTIQVVGQVRLRPALLAPSPALQTHAHASQDMQRGLLLLDLVDMPLRSQGFPLRPRPCTAPALTSWLPAWQVVHDIATAVELIAMKGVAHRDVTEGNIGRTMEGRGILMDFSAGKVRPTCLPCLHSPGACKQPG